MCPPAWAPGEAQRFPSRCGEARVLGVFVSICVGTDLLFLSQNFLMHFFVQGRETRKAVSVRGMEGGTVCVKVSALNPAFQVNALKMTGVELPKCACV